MINGGVSQEEYAGTQSDLAAVITTLKNTPADKIEALVDEFNDELTAHI